MFTSASATSRAWCCMPLIPLLRKQRRMELWELEANLVYRVAGQQGLHSERTCSKTKRQQTNNNKNPASASMHFCSKFSSFPLNHSRYQIVLSLNFSITRVQTGSNTDELFKDASVFAT